MSDMRCENCTYWTGGLRVWGYCTQHSKDTSNTDSCIMWMESEWAIKKQGNDHPDTNVGNIEYIRREDAINVAQNYHCSHDITIIPNTDYSRGFYNGLAIRENDILQGLSELKPSADVVPVIHAYWIPQKENYEFKEAWMKCSACGYPVSKWTGNTNFCPNCGAKMRGEQE